ncbi:hypothetical protein DY000_02054844 [Brassica cretica]|uniref:Uncharacterized protein n=1 Tax=Brassica cretica TaxID=69181 RepID=A0ABQ7AHY5_BRACR|nr:hypothetical protein DY000_02054844 [Brassica cretica]
MPFAYSSVSEDSSLQNHPFERLSVSAIVVGGSSAIPVSLIWDLLEREYVRPDVILAEGEEDNDDEDDDTELLQWDNNEDDVVANVQSGGIVVEEELQLLNKPNHVSTPEEAENQCGKAGCGQVLHEPFLKFLKHEEEDESEISQDTERLALEYYDPKPVCKARHACGGDRTMLFADVLGRTLSGRPLLSSRRYFRKIAWHKIEAGFTCLLRVHAILLDLIDESMIKQNVIRLKSFRDNKELFSRLTNSRYMPDIARCCKDVLKTG